MCLRFTGKTIAKNIEFSPSNGLEPATHKQRRMPTSNRLRPKGILERHRCAIGWSDIYDHSTNPVNSLYGRQLPMAISANDLSFLAIVSGSGR